MKYISTFEQLREEDEPIDLVCYPSGNIIVVTPNEFVKLKEESEFDIEWDDEPDYEEGVPGQWRYYEEDEEGIEEWLEGYRKIGDPKLYKDTKKYNL